MASLAKEVCAAPFDAIAADYDRVFTYSQIGQAQRSSVWRELTNAFSSGSRILEIGCGTGVDACFLGEQGVTVVACDSSTEMVRVAEQRVRACAADMIELQVLAAENISTLTGKNSFDGAFSNFGALNCFENLKQFAVDLAALLRPKATLLVCFMGPICIWEMAWYLAHGELKKAFRRQRRAGTEATLAPGEPSIHVHYPTVSSLVRTFAPEFRLLSWKGVGLFVPPSYAETWVGRFPNFLEWASRMDVALESCPGIRVLSDHILMRFQREDV
jgi:ubiquinone/menaquinone biosynthesis C-methylase UbiE